MPALIVPRRRPSGRSSPRKGKSPRSVVSSTMADAVTDAVSYPMTCPETEAMTAVVRDIGRVMGRPIVRRSVVRRTEVRRPVIGRPIVGRVGGTIVGRPVVRPGPTPVDDIFVAARIARRSHLRRRNAARDQHNGEKQRKQLSRDGHGTGSFVCTPSIQTPPYCRAFPCPRRILDQHHGVLPMKLIEVLIHRLRAAARCGPHVSGHGYVSVVEQVLSIGADR
jgi:hypothetical protein